MGNSHQQNTEQKDQTEKSMCTSDGFEQSKTSLWCQQVGLPLEGSSGTPFFDLGANYTGENPSSCAWRVLQFSASILYFIENSMQLRKAGLPSGTSRITCHSLPHTCRARVVCSST